MHGDVLVRARWRLAEVILTGFVSQKSNLSVLSNGQMPKASLGDSDIPYLALWEVRPW
jgi:hypothetical protein